MLVRAMLVVEPRKRALVPGVLLHPWLEGIENRAAFLYGALPQPELPEDGRPEGCRRVNREDEATRALLETVSKFGFPQAFVDESLSEGKFNHAAATFHLLAQQAVRKR
ncbi:unnamed protein product, partial [Polarella glacialis]